MILESKAAVITGAAGGIGRAAAREFASQGASVLVADLDGDEAAKLCTAIREKGGEASSCRVDVSIASDVKNMVEVCLASYGKIDVIFNNAGIFPELDGSVTTTEEELWDRVMAVNLKGVFLGCKYAIPAMLAGGGGSIVNTASFVAIMGAATSQSAYTASKGGVLALTREIAVEYARRGIRANALCPGPVNTPLLAGLLADERERQRRMVHIPMGRLGEVDEIARAAAFLASEQASFITGAAFTVDGGITAAYVTPE